MQLGAEDFFKLLEKPELPATFLLEGENAYLETQLRDELKRRGVEVHEAEIKKTGPEATLEDLSLGGSLFSPSALMWVRKIAPLSGWTESAFKTWERIVSKADGTTFALWVQVPQDRRYKWTDLAIKNKALLDVAPDKRAYWLKRMNERHAAKLDAQRLRFLLESDAELLDLDGQVELWGLGGDTWASKALGFGSKNTETQLLQSVWDGEGKPAYAWVDSVLRGERRKSVVLIHHLLSSGEEALPLLALLTKSVRLLAALEMGAEPSDQPSFLVQKMRAVLTANRRTQPRRGKALLERCAEIDRALKSSGGAPRVLLEQL